MSDAPKKKKSNVVVWAVLGLLVLALGGFGVGQFGGNLSSVASVGGKDITVSAYGNALQSEQRRLSQQTGQQLSLQQMQQFGIDRQLMERMLAATALEVEAARMGLSVGDAEVARRIRATPAFGGVTGAFDRDGYAFALRGAGLTEKRYEAQVREEAGRELLQVAVVGGVEVPDAYSAAIVGWLAETRDATFAPVTAAALPPGTVAPSPEALQAFYDENSARFEVPATRDITYAWITPDALAPEVEVDEERLRARYEELAPEFRRPARVLAERLNFRDAAAAEAALAAIGAGETDFDALVAERGLSLDDVDQGELSAADLPSDISDAIFALEEPGLAGPFETGLGPAIYRVNAILDPTETPFEAVRDDLAAELSLDTAARRIDAAREGIDDMLAGGATLEEVAAETDLELGQIAYREGEDAGIAGYEAFRAAASAVTEGDFPDLTPLSDGGLFALRLDGLTPAATPPLDDIRDAVEQAWREADTARRLGETAAALATRIAAGESFEDVGLAPESVTGISREATVEGVPPALISRLFTDGDGDVFGLPGSPERAFVARLDAIRAADPEDPETAELAQAVETQLRADLAADLLAAYGEAVLADLEFSVDQQTVQAVQSQLLGGGPAR